MEIGQSMQVLLFWILSLGDGDGDVRIFWLLLYTSAFGRILADAEGVDGNDAAAQNRKTPSELEPLWESTACLGREHSLSCLLCFRDFGTPSWWWQ